MDFSTKAPLTCVLGGPRMQRAARGGPRSRYHRQTAASLSQRLGAVLPITYPQRPYFPFGH